MFSIRCGATHNVRPAGAIYNLPRIVSPNATSATGLAQDDGTPPGLRGLIQQWIQLGAQRSPVSTNDVATIRQSNAGTAGSGGSNPYGLTNDDVFGPRIALMALGINCAQWTQLSYTQKYYNLNALNGITTQDIIDMQMAVIDRYCIPSRSTGVVSR